MSVTEQVQKAEGVPVIAPVDELRDRPVGRPVCVQVKLVSAVDESVAVGVSVEIAVDLLDRWLALEVTVTVLVTFQVNVVELLYAHAVVGVPVMAPVPELMESPAGRPVADQLMVAVDEVSVATGVRVEIAAPETLDWVEIAVTATVLVMVQVNADVETALAKLSVAVKVTEQAHAVVGVPVMAPVAELIARPAGRPDCVQVTAVELWVE